MIVGKGWKPATLGDLADVISGYAFSSRDFQSSGVPVLKISNIRVGDVDLSDVQCVDPQFLSLDQKYHVKQGDLLISLTGSHVTQPNSVVGRVAFFRNSMRQCLLNQRVGKVIIRDSRICDSRFLFYMLRVPSRMQEIAAMAHGAASQANVSPKQVESLQLRLPPIQLQHRIASILSAYDDLIENNASRIKILEEMTQMIYREWFVNFRFPGHEEGRTVSSELGSIPDGWNVKAFADLGTFVNGYAFGPEHWGKIGRPILKIKELKSGVTIDTPRYAGPELDSKYIVHTGDLLFSWSADLDVYIWSGTEALLNQHLFRVRPSEKVGRLFMFCSLKSRMGDFRSRSMGTTMRHIKRSALNEVKLAVADTALTSAFETLVEPLMALVINLNLTNNNLRQTRDLLLPKVVSGEINVEHFEREAIAQGV